MKKLINLALSMTMGLTLLSGAVIVAAPAANAIVPAVTPIVTVASDTGCDTAAGQFCDNTKGLIGKKPAMAPSIPAGCTGSCLEQFNRSDSWEELETYGGSKYFWDKTPLPALYFGDTLDYDFMYGYNMCTARKGFANAPLGGTTYVIKASLYFTKSVSFTQRTKNGVTYIEESAPVVIIEGDCTTYTTPNEKLVELTSFGEGTFNGPFDHNGKEMLSKDAGGTSGRTNLAGVNTAQGDVVFGASVLGKAILAEQGFPVTISNYPRLKTLAATPRTAHKYISNDLSYIQNLDQDLTSYGRYYMATQRWRNVAHVYEFIQYKEFTDKMFPVIFAQAGDNYFSETSRNYPMYIPKVSGPKVVNDLQLWKLSCVSAGSPQGINNKTDVATPSNFGSARDLMSIVNGFQPAVVLAAAWGDNEDTYSFECANGLVPGEPTRTKDLFICDPYDVVTVTARPTTTSWGVTGSYWQSSGYNQSVSVPQFRDRGADYTNGQWIGRPCWPGESDAGHACVSYSQGWEWVDTSGWVSSYGNVTTIGNCPAGTTPSGINQCTGRVAGGKIVDNKSASPISDVTPNWVKGNFVDRVKITTGAFADPFRIEWKKPIIRINTGSLKGNDVNSLPASADVRWSRNWKLALGSSPVLRPNTGSLPNDTSRNATNGPVHIFNDLTPTTKTDAPSRTQNWNAALDGRESTQGSLRRWVGLETKGWEESQRAIYLKFWLNQNADRPEGWVMTPNWKVTATVPITSSEITGMTVGADGEITFNTTTLTKQSRETYFCPGQTLQVNTFRVVN